MSNIIFMTEDQIKSVVKSAFDKAITAGELNDCQYRDFAVEIPADRNHGDYSVNAAMVNAKTFSLPPRKIAEILCANMDFSNTFIEKSDIAGPGFINFFVSNSFYGSILKDVEEKGEKYGNSNFGEGKKVMVEFVSANPTGPMHIGNARGGALGDVLSSVLDAAGFHAHREFYVNDAGNQIEKFAVSLNARYLQLYKEGIEIPEDAYHGQDIIDHAKNFAEINGDKFVDADEKTRKDALVDYALPINVKRLHDDLETYRITYDHWFMESTVHNNGEVARVIELLKQSGYTYEQEGALWFKATDFGAEKDYVLVRANGFPTYIVPDIAYHYNKLVTRNFDKAINVLGADHHGYAPRLKFALRAIGIDDNRLEFVLMQMVRLIRDGEVIKASKRTGKSITLSTLLEEVPIDAARFFFNMREANSHFDFDLDLAVEQSSDNPVYYVQYAHARICSILKNLESEGITQKKLDIDALNILTASEEKELIRHIGALTGDIVLSAKENNPAIITKYSVELATKFHKFYNACRVKGENEDILQARLFLCLCVKTVLSNVLSLLKITAPETM